MFALKPDNVESALRDVAQRCILPHFRNLHAGEVKFKGEDDPVTVADQESEAALTAALTALLPGSRVVGEEAFASDPSLLDAFAGDAPVWIVDPIDGTKMFIAGEPLFGVIVALAKGGETVAGWLYDPNSDAFVTAEKGAGAWYKGQKLSVLPPAPLTDLTGTMRANAHEVSGEDSACLGLQGGPKFYPVRSACHDYAALVVGEPHFACQRSQLHFHGTHSACTPWDNAAGVLIHAEAGGYTAHWDGQPFAPAHYGKSLLSAPDKASWHLLRAWAAGVCDK